MTTGIISKLIYPRLGRVVLSAIPAAIVATVLVKYAYPHNLILIVTEGLIYMFVFAALGWWFVLNKEEREQILVIFKRKFPSEGNMGYGVHVGTGNNGLEEQKTDVLSQ